MMQVPFLVVAVLLGAAVSVPAQFQGRSGHARVGVVAAPTAQHQALRGGREGPVLSGPRLRNGHGERAREHGRWEVRYENVLVPGYWHVECVPPTYGWIYSHCGHRHWGIVDRGGERRTWVPARWEQRAQRVWVRC